jgi:hypothetical protein
MFYSLNICQQKCKTRKYTQDDLSGRFKLFIYFNPIQNQFTAYIYPIMVVFITFVIFLKWEREKF